MSKNKTANILIIEDDVFLADLYKTKFTLEGFKVAVAYDGERGRDAAIKDQPDIILLDLVLPKISGFDILKEVKSNSKSKDIPVILLTNLSQKADVERGLKLGAADFLIKAHFMPSEVVEKIKKLIN
ncbi:MAG: response regulator [Patescibacteria group bacterium]